MRVPVVGDELCMSMSMPMPIVYVPVVGDDPRLEVCGGSEHEEGGRRVCTYTAVFNFENDVVIGDYDWYWYNRLLWF